MKKALSMMALWDLAAFWEAETMIEDYVMTFIIIALLLYALVLLINGGIRITVFVWRLVFPAKLTEGRSCQNFRHVTFQDCSECAEDETV